MSFIEAELNKTIVEFCCILAILVADFKVPKSSDRIAICYKSLPLQ